MCEFNKQDVLAVAKALSNDPLEYMDGDFTPYYFCHYCDAELRGYGISKEEFKHDNNCPVLIAQDILTRNL